MAVACVWGPSGSGKTTNSTLVNARDGKKNLLLCSDGSHLVLRNFERPNLDIETVSCWFDTDKFGKPQTCFIQQFERAVESGKYSTIICDNVSDYFEMGVLEGEESGRWKDGRQLYQNIYQSLKRLARKATLANCDIIFNCWSATDEITLPSGQKAQRMTPKLPNKILDPFMGLCNIVAYVTTAEKNGEKRWYYHLEGSETLYAKDQLHCRKTCLPEDIFSGANK